MSLPFLSTRRWLAPALVLGLAGAIFVFPAAAQAQDATGPSATPPTVEDIAKQAEKDLAAQPAGEPDAVLQGPVVEEPKINLLELLFKGGPLMWPILLMSLVVVAFGAERMLGLRRRKVLPPALIHGLGALAGQPGGLDPRKAYKLCQQYPSAAANIIRSMLLKVGRPHAELETAVTEAQRREGTKLFANIRWLVLAEGVAPLLGLLGTVWGMILAFFATANLPTGANKAQVLAEGIYQALVTTLAGLTVAIPAALLAHMFEGKIQRLFCELDETLLGLMPQLERFEGRLRVRHDDPADAPMPETLGTTDKHR
ncbi:MAG: MotA/TolQ/ExbB proton channel family protein [Pirellulales bacterium]|nr:MotA/TolQ/ExbB proton channel family protein [Pirellulales bacterium]